MALAGRLRSSPVPKQREHTSHRRVKSGCNPLKAISREVAVLASLKAAPDDTPKAPQEWLRAIPGHGWEVAILASPKAAQESARRDGCDPVPAPGPRGCDPSLVLELRMLETVRRKRREERRARQERVRTTPGPGRGGRGPRHAQGRADEKRG
uniref:Uncharacterized protein n=1 Tax=Mycena chlorophos TaxID=658473 RepID=A0ABQ0LW76_MYCCL|nr:predicted protein [Mycena chlorophos]